MSILRCPNCEEFIDTDEYDECDVRSDAENINYSRTGIKRGYSPRGIKEHFLYRNKVSPHHNKY